jgi:hypothetical protein
MFDDETRLCSNATQNFGDKSNSDLEKGFQRLLSRVILRVNL